MMDYLCGLNNRSVSMQKLSTARMIFYNNCSFY